MSDQSTSFQMPPVIGSWRDHVDRGLKGRQRAVLNPEEREARCCPGFWDWLRRTTQACGWRFAYRYWARLQCCCFISYSGLRPQLLRLPQLNEFQILLN